MNGPLRRRISPRGKLVLATLGVVMGVAGRQVYVETAPLFRQASVVTTAERVEMPTAVTPLPDPERLAKPHLEWAEAETERTIEESLAPLRTFFRDSKRRTEEFAGDVLGFRSKMKLVWDTLPLTEKTHPSFVRTRFEEKIFKAADLEQVVEQAVASFLQRMEGIEGEMLVRLRTDMADFPQAYSVERLGRESLKHSYEAAIENALKASGDDLSQATSQLVVSTVAGEVLTIVALRIGVSAGILGAGGASGTVTLGVGVVVGLIVDQIVSFVWDWYADPKGNLAAQLNSRLDDMMLVIVSGPDGQGGLQGELRKLAASRAKLRREALMKVLEVQ